MEQLFSPDGATRHYSPFAPPMIANSQPTLVDPLVSSASARIAHGLIEARRRRRKHFKSSLFSEPAWDILLELFVAECDGRRIPITAAGVSAGIPLTTVLRWLTVLQKEGLVRREDDPLDKRRSYLSLSGHGMHSMKEYFGALERGWSAMKKPC